MATSDVALTRSEPTLFVRRATGLVRGWSVFDAFLYASMSVSLVALGFYIFSFAPFIPSGNLLWGLVIGCVLLLFQVVTYACLIAVMPRAGGDYIWISRVLGGGLAFVLTAAGWWFIIWHWIPIYANLLTIEIFDPVARVVGAPGFASYWATHRGVFLASLITAAITSVLVALGIRAYAHIQRLCFWGGMAGLLLMFAILLSHSHASFVASFNHNAQAMFAAKPGAYQAVVRAGSVKAGYHPPGFSSLDVSATFLLLPMLFFYNLWSNWGGSLYGEVRGASDFRKNVAAMGGALVFSTILAIAAIVIFRDTIGWTFYNALNNAYWSHTGPVSDFPYPGLIAAMAIRSELLQLLVIALLGLWFIGSVGTVFLSSTRAVFAFAFDRLLPEWAARVNRHGVPWVALLLMVAPSIVVSYFYAYNSRFPTWTLDATLVIAVAFLGSAVSAAILPWRRRGLYESSPIARYRIARIPLITVAAGVFVAVLVYALVKWLRDPVYGVNNGASLRYMGALYGLALVVYLLARVVRRRQGIDLASLNREIPAE